MQRVSVNVWAVEHYTAAGEIFFGAAVIRSGAGTVVKAIDGSNTRGFLGVAQDNYCGMQRAGCYQWGQAVPVITAGIVNLPIVGGGTAITAGCLLSIANDLGLFALESATDESASATCARALENMDPSLYTCSLTTGTAGSKVLTVDDTTYFAAGNMVLLEGTSGLATDSEIAQVESIDSGTQMTLKEPCRFSYSSKNVRKICQVRAKLRT
jgi:hypothetical protein